MALSPAPGVVHPTATLSPTPTHWFTPLQVQTGTNTNSKHSNNAFYLGVIIFLSIAWFVTLIFLYLEHKPCHCPQSQVSVVQHPPTTTTHQIPFRGTFQVPTLTSPGPTGDVDSVIHYLQRRGSSLSGRPFNSDIYKSLTTPWLWQWNRSVNPPVGVFPSPAPNKPTLYIVFNVQQQKWDVSTISPFQESIQ